MSDDTPDATTLVPISSTAAIAVLRDLVDTELSLVDEAARRDPAACYLSRLSRSSQATMATCLDGIARFLSSGRANRSSFPWARVRYAHALLLRSHLAERMKPSTANVYLCAFRGVLRETRLLGGLDDATAAELGKAIAEIKNVPAPNIAAGDPLNAGERAALWAACDADPDRVLGTRDRALFALFFATGGRVSAVTAVNLADYDPSTGDILFREVKRGRMQRDRVSASARAELAAWLELRGNEPGPLLCPVVNGRVTVRRLDRSSVTKLCARRSREAGIRRRSAHDWRHSVATELDRAGVSLRLIQSKLGHASISTTQRYVHADADALRRASELLVVPTRR